MIKLILSLKRYLSKSRGTLAKLGDWVCVCRDYYYSFLAHYFLVFSHLAMSWLSGTPWTAVRQASLSFNICLGLASVSPSVVSCQLLCPWDSPGKNTGMGCHFLLLSAGRCGPNRLQLHHRSASQLPSTISLSYQRCPFYSLFHHPHFRLHPCNMSVLGVGHSYWKVEERQHYNMEGGREWILLAKS